MTDRMRFNIADQRLEYTGERRSEVFNSDQVAEFNHRHHVVLNYYDLSLDEMEITNLVTRSNNSSNLGVLRNRQLRESAILAAALSAVAVALDGRGSLKKIPEKEVTRDLKEKLKRANDRRAAQIMAEVLQNTAESLPACEEVLIESAITEGVRAKPGKEAGGNPTIAVGALFGKEQHRARYGLPMDSSVTLLSMGNDVIDGTTKSIKGDHSSLTALFLTESGIKRHLPDIYVQRWMAGTSFKEFNPREARLTDAAEIIGESYGLPDTGKLSSYFLDRERHYPAMDLLNQAGITTPFDKDGDLFPALLLGFEDLQFPDGRGLMSMIGEIGGSAEWAVGVLPLVWRGGQALGMLTSQSTLSNKDLSPEELWRERFHYTEEEYMLIQDARFEQKPYFTIADILENPFAGGISAFGAITDNYFLPFMKGVKINKQAGSIKVDVLTVNSLGLTDLWHFKFHCEKGVSHTVQAMKSPKDALETLSGSELDKAIGGMLSDGKVAGRYRLMFNNEYYPALIPIRDRMVLLHKVIDTLISRGALNQQDKDIVNATKRLAPDWFVGYE
jgi:fructose-1,6-bisphosphatase/sedoheptulose 1,7-bisphosphatase-like protein